MKKIMTLAVGIATVVPTLLAITLQNAPRGSVVQTGDKTVVVNTAAPKYSLSEAIDLCIADLTTRGQPVTVGAVKNRLMRMPASDVDLGVSGLAQTVREAIETYEAKQLKTVAAPDPKAYAKSESFVTAYADWKKKSLTTAQRDALRKKLGAEAKFVREAKKEAAQLWTEAQAK